MKILWTAITIILTILAVSSGVTKVLLMEEDAEFFGRYGFSEPMLIVFGGVQILGGALLALERARILGAAIVAATFLVSLVLLLLDGNVTAAIATGVATVLLGFVIARSRSTSAAEAS